MTEGNPCGTAVGLDLAKNILSMHGIDQHGKAVMKRTISRDYKRAAVSLAEKNARTIWAMLAKGQTYSPAPAA